MIKYFQRLNAFNSLIIYSLYCLGNFIFPLLIILILISLHITIFSTLPSSTGHMFVEIVGVAANFLNLAFLLTFCNFAFKKSHLKIRNHYSAAWKFGSISGFLFSIFLGVLVSIIVISFALFTQNPFTFSKDSYFGQQSFLLLSTNITIIVLLNLLKFASVSVTEELLTRGLIFGGFRKSFGIMPAIIGSTTLFILLHFPIKNPLTILTYLLISGTALYIRIRSKSTYMAAVFHFIYNISLLFYFIWVSFYF